MPPPKLTQDKRIGKLTTPLGKDMLVVVRFQGTEGLSELFEYRFEALSEHPDLDFDAAIGQQCTFTLDTYGDKREFSGFLVEAQWLGTKSDYYHYSLVLRPWLWLLSRCGDCRIFQEKKAPEIIKTVFQDRGFTDFQSRLTDEGSYPEHEYCVQYRETDLNFVTRLMEKEGIYYYFTHKNNKHTLVLADSKSSHDPVPNHASMPFIESTGRYVRKEERIYEWLSERRFQTGKIKLNDYDYEKPDTSLLSEKSGSEIYTRSNMEVFDYPGNYKEQSIGERYAAIQLESEQALDYRRHGSGDAAVLFPGGLTKLEKHATSSQNIEYLIVRATHGYEAEEYRSSGGLSAEDPYHGAYEFLPSDRQYRARIVTPKPLIHGIQTAKVVTKDEGSSEEIDVEELTEIYVKFHWYHREDDKRSVKLRCAQLWSGKKWGGQFIPRVGQEVVVEFLDGDPDRPLVVGTVYNNNNKPPYDLPSDKTIAGIKSDSTKGGNGYNELNFDDQKNQEKITLHAEKDHDVTVQHAETWTIGDTFEMPTGSPSREVTIKKGDDKLTLSTGSRQIEVAMNSELKANLQIKLDGGVLIELVCGASKITMTPASIELNAPLISLSGAMIKIN